MKLKLVVAICFIVGFAYGADVTANVTTSTEAPTTTSTEAPMTTRPSSPPTTASTTPSPSPPTTHPTTVPSTPSTSPTTPPTSTPPTTPSPTPTTPSPTPTPSPVPTTSAPPAPSTTPAPLPKMWMVKDPATNITCILAQMEVTFNVHNGKSQDTIKISPATASAIGGHCGSPVQTLRVVWAKENMTSSMELSFNASKTNYHVSGINLTLYYNTSEGEVGSQFSNGNLSLYDTNLNTSYSCASVEMPSLKNPQNITVNIKFSDLLIEAFRPLNSTKFSASHYCSGEVPDIVPLVVGIALAGLVLVVVIAYLIGRRRSQARGYLSM